MKKILLLALPLMVMCFASCEKSENSTPYDEWKDSWTDDSPIIQFKDPKFLNALLNVSYSDGYYPAIPVDRNEDGQISEKEAAVTTEIMLFETGIRNMDEIKYFTSLQSLYCDSNQLTTLDLSNNVALIYLNCYGNKLTTLDLSNNSALTELNCYGNKLTTLDLSNNSALTELNCGGNQLTSLDLKMNPALTELDCRNNQLSSLDLSGNTGLTVLSCYDNQLVTLDVSNNTSLVYLFCYSNDIASLDVSMCRDLERLACVEVDYSGFANYDTQLPLESLKIYKFNMIEDKYIKATEEVYGDILEYVE